MTDYQLPEREWKPGDPPVLPPIPDEAYPPGAEPLDVALDDEIRAALESNPTGFPHAMDVSTVKRLLLAERDGDPMTPAEG